MKVDLKKAGVGDVIASEGNWELRHTDRTINTCLRHNAIVMHQCPKDPDYHHWGTPRIDKDGERALKCLYCEVVAPTKLMNQWFDITAEEK